GGLGLPDRDYYLGGSDKFEEIKAKYERHIAASFQLIGQGEQEAKEAAREIVALETRLAKASKTRIEMRDPEGRYNKYTLSELDGLAPSIEWKSYFSTLDAKTDEVIV